MPNHASNALFVSGPDTDAFFAAVEAGGDDNFINTLIPVPEIMENISTGSAKVDGEVVRVWRNMPGGGSQKVTDIDLQHMMDLYGCTNAYDYAVRHWGTKWGAYDTRVERTEGYIKFDSAWSPPMTAVETIAKMFPRNQFRLAYAEGGACYFGQATFADGELLDQWDREDFWDENAEQADIEDDYMNGLTVDCRVFLEENGLHTGG